MMKSFNTEGVCIPSEHYMVQLDERLRRIKAEFIDKGKYFTINRARQYGKTTTLNALSNYLKEWYEVLELDFQMLSHSDFVNESAFVSAFAREIIVAIQDSETVADVVKQQVKDFSFDTGTHKFALLFQTLSKWCKISERPIVLMIDEVDSATNNQVFLDFLAQLRGYYLQRMKRPTFQSVILAGVHDVKNLRRKIRSDEDHKINSPWNIAADFNIDMSFSAGEIAGMLQDYEADHHTGMDILDMAQQIYDYTSGYPFLVSRLCKLVDESVLGKNGIETRGDAWTSGGFHEAIKMLLAEKNTLFESLSEKLIRYPEMNSMLCSVLFTGKNIVCNYYEPSISVASMFGFVKNQNGSMMVANRIFETWLYNYYLSTAEMQSKDIYAASLLDKNQFIVNGHLNMRLVLERFAVHFTDLYGDKDESFIEEEGRKYFLLYLRPIINGIGNYYIESRTRGMRRTDVIIDYRGEQYIVEMKIWHGNEYHRRGEKQLVDYLDDYHKNVGYMVSFNFNKNKNVGVKEIVVGDKILIEAVV